ncbi:hypothetical protein SeMB42_g03762 [Synchytrium endobioticum]|uniref:Uncharacterized protein n=1 Tax=Synchytrium endobioticum TaxID=286115 RepID=A0A507D4P3_9FUNG|nr:hypothetical protein SeMB42_g03762 [Synchytrium endobioticum]
MAKSVLLLLLSILCHHAIATGRRHQCASDGEYQDSIAAQQYLLRFLRGHNQLPRVYYMTLLGTFDTDRLQRDIEKLRPLKWWQAIHDSSRGSHELRWLFYATVIAMLITYLRDIIEVYKFNDLYHRVPLAESERHDLILRACLLKRLLKVHLRSMNEHARHLGKERLSLSDVLVHGDVMGVKAPLAPAHHESLTSKFDEFKKHLFAEIFKLDLVFDKDPSSEELATMLMTNDQLHEKWNELGLPALGTSLPDKFRNVLPSYMSSFNLRAAAEYHSALKVWNEYVARYKNLNDDDLRVVPMEVVESFRKSIEIVHEDSTRSKVQGQGTNIMVPMPELEPYIIPLSQPLSQPDSALVRANGQSSAGQFGTVVSPGPSPFWRIIPESSTSDSPSSTGVRGIMIPSGALDRGDGSRDTSGSQSARLTNVFCMNVARCTIA